jgi:hypothetical protein
VTYVYIQSEPSLWTVGHWGPDGDTTGMGGTGRWHPESDHGSPGEAARRVAELNGAGPVLEIPFHSHRDGSRHAGRSCGGCPRVTLDRTSRSAVAIRRAWEAAQEGSPTVVVLDRHEIAVIEPIERSQP